MRTLLPLGILMILLSACSANYFIPGQHEKLKAHKIIAILPYETIYNGKLPAGMTRAEWEESERRDAIAFQKHLSDAIRKRLQQTDDYLTVDIQNVRTTNHMLAKYGMNVYDARALPAERLADTLQVDAVFIVQVERERFMNDGEVVGITAFAAVLSAVMRSEGPLVDLGFPPKENIWVDAVLYDGENGESLWVMSEQLQISLRKHDTAIEQINSHISRHFPYLKN